jgi:hypothetical protein
MTGLEEVIGLIVALPITTLLAKDVVVRVDAAFAKPELYEALEARGVPYAIRIPSNDTLEQAVAELLTRPVGRPSHKPVARYKSFRYQAASWTRPYRENPSCSNITSKQTNKRKLTKPGLRRGQGRERR